MEIRLAEERDIPRILDLLRQVGQVHHQGRPDLFRAGAQKYDRAALLALMADGDAPIFVADAENGVAGYAMCRCISHRDEPVMADFSTLYIDDLCVDEHCRGQHTGSALYRHAAAYARARGCRSVTLNVWACNPGAMRFYEAMGLKPQKIGLEALLEES